jgi:hypothetical protein
VPASFTSYLLPLTPHPLPLTPSLLRRLRVPRRERHPAGQLSIEADLEGVLTRPGQRDIEHQDRPRLDVDHSRRRFAELHGAFPSQKLASTLIHEANTDRVNSDLGTPSANPKHQVGAGIYRREIGEPHVLKHAEHTELALLIDQGVVSDYREIEMQLS